MLCFSNNLKTTDKLRISQADLDYRYPKYHNFSSRSYFADKLEVSAILKVLIYCRYIAGIKSVDNA